jgi:hypothetical protein
MEASGQNIPLAWQPVTPRGVAAFAQARPGRLLVVQLAVAILAAVVVVWFVRANWFPVISEAIRHLPEQGQIRGERLEWPGESPTTLAENRFVALAVDLKHEGQARSPAHLQVEFGQSSVKVFSLFGFFEQRYSRKWRIAFNRQELQPWWGAWTPALLALTAIGVVGALMLSWSLLSVLYSPVAWLIAFLADRELTFRGSLRMAGAALMPGALLFTAAIVSYGLGLIDLVGLLILAAAHLLAGWIYLCVSPWFLPLCAEAKPLKDNPFLKGSS